MLSGTKRAQGQGRDCSRPSALRSLLSGTGHGGSSPGAAPPSPRPPQPRRWALGGASLPSRDHCAARSRSQSRSQPLRSPEQAVHRHPAQRAAARPLPHQRSLHGAQQWLVGPEAAAQRRAHRLHPPLPLAGPRPGPRRRCRRRHRSLTASTSARLPRARARRRHGGLLLPPPCPFCAPPSWRRRGPHLVAGRTRVARAPPRAEVRGAAPEVSSAHAQCRWRRRETRWYRSRAGRGAERSLGRDAAGDHHPAAGPVRQPE